MEFRAFLVRIDQEVPEEFDLHLVLDNLSTHKTPSIERWLLQHPRFQLHFTPTYSSWINQVERWFAESSPASSCAAVCTAAPGRWRTTSASTSPPATTIRIPSSGSRPLMRSWPASNGFAVDKSPVQDTSGVSLKW